MRLDEFDSTTEELKSRIDSGWVKYGSKLRRA
jgi:hypothetical protein